MPIMTLPYHIGIVVTDVRSEMERLTAILGVQWCEAVTVPLRLDTPPGVVDTVCEFVYSSSGPPILELIRHTPQGPWDQLGLHHLGFWSDSLHDSHEMLEAHGLERESVLTDGGGLWKGGLHMLTQDGLRLEIADIATSGPRLARYQRGGGWA